jgi:hypothetical protein
MLYLITKCSKYCKKFSATEPDVDNPFVIRLDSLKIHFGVESSFGVK